MKGPPMLPTETEFIAALIKVVAAFESLGIDYALGGSFASSLHGEARATRDADLISAVVGKHAEPLARMLQGEFYVDAGQIAAAAQSQGSFNLIHLESMSKVDVYVVWRSEFGRSQLARKEKKMIGHPNLAPINVASAEDTVLAKLDWYRKGGAVSDRQWRDVLGVLKVQAGALDRAYLREWAIRLGLTDLLHHALDDAGLPPEPPTPSVA